MARWHKIRSGAIVKTVSPRNDPVDIATGDDGNPVWRPEVEDKPAFDSATERLEGPSTVIEATQVVRRFTKRAKTAQELADEAVDVDQRAVLDGLVDLAEIVIIHVDAHLAKGNISGSDFNVATRRKYQDLKVVVDRLRNA